MADEITGGSVAVADATPAPAATVDTGAGDGGGDPWADIANLDVVENEDGSFSGSAFEKAVTAEEDEDFEFDEPAPVGSGEGSEDAPPEEDLTPQERALRKLEQEDPEGYQAIIDEMQRAQEFQQAEMKRAQDAEIQRRKDAGDLLADVDPVVAEAWKNQVASTVLAPLFTEVHNMAPAFAAGIENGFIAPMAEAVMNTIDNMAAQGVEITSATAKDLILQVFGQMKPELESALAGDMRTITNKMMRASIDTAKISHGATVEGNKSRAVQAELHGQFAEKVAGVEKTLGRKLTGEEREEHLTLFGTYLKAMPNMSPVDALEKVFRAFESGAQAGREAGKVEAVKRRTQVASESAHLQSGVTGQRKPGYLDKEDLTEEDLMNMSEDQINKWAAHQEKRRRSA